MYLGEIEVTFCNLASIVIQGTFNIKKNPQKRAFSMNLILITDEGDQLFPV